MKPARIAYVAEVTFGLLVLVTALALPAGDLTPTQAQTLWLLLAQSAAALVAATALRLGMRWGWMIAAVTAGITLVRIPAGVWLLAYGGPGSAASSGGAIAVATVLWASQLIVALCLLVERPWRKDRPAVA